MQRHPIYMDNNSTTRVDPRVVEAMLPFFTEEYGNAASITHRFGSSASGAVESARTLVGELIGADAKSIVFTSGATESNNIALLGAMRAATPGCHLITNAAEHKAVIDPAKKLQREGFQVTVLPVDQSGMVDPLAVSDALQPDTTLVSVMAANNEVGTINRIDEIGIICRKAGVLFHTDATQAVGKLPINLAELQADLLSLSAHKLHGPKGIGALFVRKSGSRIRIEPLVEGGGHERRLRSGTLPVQQVVGLGEACRIAHESLIADSQNISELRDRLRIGLTESIPDITVNGHPEQRLPGNLHVTFKNVNGDALMTRLKDVVAVSSGSACTTSDPEPSHVLIAMGLNESLVDSSIRFGLGRFNTDEEVDTVVAAIRDSVSQLRRLTLS